tara:strand:+ start:1161 stop:2090 length:930 start_codon:yes stop_codon:yes gene_type:complete
MPTTLPDLDLEIAPFHITPPPEACWVDRRFIVGSDYFACEDTSKILWWKVEIRGWESCSQPTRVRIDRSFVGTVAIGSRLTDCLIRYKLCLKQAPAIHCCGVVSQNGSGYILSGRSGVGKSTIAMHMMDRGCQLLGDNWVIAHQGQAKSFHLPINIYNYNVSSSFFQKLPKRLKFDLWWKTYARNLSMGYLKKATHVILKDVDPDRVAHCAPLKRVFTFSQGETFLITMLNRQSGLKRLVANDMMDRDAFHRYMLAYASVFPDGVVANYWQKLHESLSVAIPPEIEFVDVIVPRQITAEHVAEIGKWMD